jgi:hypothetical protein
MVSAEKRELFTDAGRAGVHAFAGQAAIPRGVQENDFYFKAARHAGAHVTRVIS